LTQKAREGFFTARDGLRLFSRIWPAERGRGTLLLVHGFAEHSGRYARLAEDLNQAGYCLATFDLRGHGRSEGRRAHVDSFDDYLGDCRAFIEQLGDECPRPHWLLGHSMGGLIAARYRQRHGGEFVGLVLSSPFLGFAIKVPAIKALAGRALSSLWPTLAMKTGLDPTVLSHDRQVVEEYRNDPLVSDIATARWFTEVIQAQQEARKQAGSLAGPLLVLQAGDDRLSSLQTTQAFFDAYGGVDKQIQVYDGFLHEVFNENERQRPLEDLLSWLGEHTA